jgi:phage terminase large subunit-like protein
MAKKTSKWIHNEADQRAADRGCRLDESRGQHMIDFCQDHLRLYEGEYAGLRVELMDWQQELFMQLFGWVHFSKDWNREVRRFTRCGIWLPKKSGKSPVAAMVGLYLLTSDAESGQKVFSAAKDGKQAGIVHAHARAMVDMSPALSAECKINNTNGVIAHLPTRSSYSILRGDNISGQEGLNGSVIIDETHVVDSRLAAVLEYMGASRSEPIQFEVSTAGNNPQSYGKRQWDYGKAVNEGMIDDDSFLFVEYAAPAGLTDAEYSKPAIWKAANPSWGVTIKGGEFKTSHQRASRSISDFQRWKQYRLNVWSAAQNIWLKTDDWTSCQVDLDLAALEGQPCYIGLDLSRTRDMTAAVCVFPDEDGETYTLLPFFWLPEETAKANNHLASYMNWAEQGYLETTPGNVVDYSYVERRIADLAQLYNVQELVFDPTYAEELTQRLENDSGIPRSAFRQTVMAFAGPTAEFERLVIGKQLRHGGHPIMDWQAGHVQVKQDNNANKRPVKPAHDDPKKIDGIVAAIMALGRAQAADAEPTYNYYEDNQLELM